MRRAPQPRILAGILMVLALVLVPAFVRAQGANATLRGRVVDDTGAPLGGIAVQLSQPATGFSRSATTGRDGTYLFAAIPPGTYVARFEQQGFTTIEDKNVVLNVASTRQLDVKLHVAAVAETVTVSSEVPVLRTEPTMGVVVSEQELQNLPLNGRQFANLAVLAPATQLSYNTDPTKPDQLTVSLNGGSGRNVNYVVDGGDNTDDTIGGALQNFSLENVQEFKIQTQQFKAEYGRSTGGVLNVVTKSGTNEFHGGLFEYYRDKSLNSETESEKRSGSGKQDYSRDQFGASLGGPIVKDKLHFFVGLERTNRDTKYTVDSGGIYPDLDGQAVALPFRDDLVAAKATADLSASQFLQVRFGYQKNTSKYGASPVVPPESLGTVTNKYTSLLVGHQAQISAAALNEFVFQYTKFENGIAPDSNAPTVYYPSGVIGGQNPNMPQHTYQTKYQFKDDYSWSLDMGEQRHDLKFGFNYIHEPTLGGDFSAGVASPQFTAMEDSADSPITDIVQYSGFNGQKTPVNQYSFYAQDDWRISPNLTVNVGLRYDLWLGYNLSQKGNPILETLSTQTRYTDAAYYDDFRGWDGKLENDKNNLGPRFGFSWDATGQSKTFVHGGWGIYYDFPYTNATILFPASATQSDYGVAYSYHDGDGIKNADGSFFHVGDPLPPNQLPGTDVPPPNEVAKANVTNTPFSRQTSLGVSHQLTDWLAVSLDLTSILYRDIPFRFKANPIDPATGERRFPEYGNFRIWTGGGEADYKGASLSFNARVADTLRLQGFYTWSEIEGNVLIGADEFRLTAFDYQPDLVGGSKKDVSVNPLDPNCNDKCVGPLATDSRHKITLGATWNAIWGINISPMYRYRSATPYMIYTSEDPNGDGYRIDLPAGTSHVMAGRGHSFQQLDLAISKEFEVANMGIEIVAQMFNLLNTTNPSGYRGDVSQPDTYGQPSRYAGDPAQGEQRLLQLGARIRF